MKTPISSTDQFLSSNPGSDMDNTFCEQPVTVSSPISDPIPAKRDVCNDCPASEELVYDNYDDSCGHFSGGLIETKFEHMPEDEELWFDARFEFDGDIQTEDDNSNFIEQFDIRHDETLNTTEYNLSADESKFE